MLPEDAVLGPEIGQRLGFLGVKNLIKSHKIMLQLKKRSARLSNKYFFTTFMCIKEETIFKKNKYFEKVRRLICKKSK